MVQELLPSLIMVLVQFEFADVCFSHPRPFGIFRRKREKTSNDLVNFYPSFLLFGFWADSEPNHILCWFKELDANYCMCVIKSPSSTHFFLAVIFKHENAKLKTLAGQAKLMGTLIGVGGAMLLSMYHGPVVPIGESGIDVNIMKNTITKDSNGDTQGNLIGPILIIISAFTWAVWFIIQAKMGNIYPAPYSSSALMMAMATFE
ncbi:unnamed protein product [Lactuca virosa]|uniref:WAT1-related protein n=1 Tax=Lactuca virosa TaxID=75947 RepID=A0AAU9P209_9ASTR|nr:unnamed protein product [Lactuca virosa]